MRLSKIITWISRKVKDEFKFWIHHRNQTKNLLWVCLMKSKFKTMRNYPMKQKNKFKIERPILIKILNMLYQTEDDWDQNVSATIHTKTFKKPLNSFRKPLFWHFVWEIVKAPATNFALLQWPVRPWYQTSEIVSEWEKLPDNI
jgi:hypothetical protein